MPYLYVVINLVLFITYVKLISNYRYMCNNVGVSVQCLNMFVSFEANRWISSGMAILSAKSDSISFCLSFEGAQ